jgi:D-beta-D-heptose 7-phosphate kinase/D-beta-D-heptose 1-phosphate adenosyltransferase
MDTQPRKLLKVLLLGDHCEDVYHYGVCERISPEAPVPILKKFKTVTKEGMSSNVKNNLESLGIKVIHYHNKAQVSRQ